MITRTNITFELETASKLFTFVNVAHIHKQIFFFSLCFHQTNKKSDEGATIRTLRVEGSRERSKEGEEKNLIGKEVKVCLFATLGEEDFFSLFKTQVKQA